MGVADYDNDGDLDQLFTNLDEPPTLLRNESATGNWLMVQLSVPPGAATAFGTLVPVEAGGRTQWRDVASGGSYMSTHDPRLHFGLGEAGTADRVKITLHLEAIIADNQVMSQGLHISPSLPIHLSQPSISSHAAD